MKTIYLPADTEYLYLDEMAHLIANAIWPNSDVNFQAALETLKPELEQAANCGLLRVRHPQTLGLLPPVVLPDDYLDRVFHASNSFPMQYGVVLVSDFTAFVANRGITVAVEAPEQTPQPQPAPAQNTATPEPVVIVNANNAPSRKRRDLMTPVIEAAQLECKDPFDAPAVWAVLVRMVKAGKRPLLGVSDEGIKWQDANDEPQFFTLKNLRDRLHRSHRKAR